MVFQRLRIEQLRSEAMSGPLTQKEVEKLTSMHYGGKPVFPAGIAYFSARFGSPKDGLGSLSEGLAGELLKIEKGGTPLFTLDQLTETVQGVRTFKKPSAEQGAIIRYIVNMTGGAKPFRPATREEANVLYCDEWVNYSRN